MKPNKPVAFAYFHDNQLHGFLTDTFCKTGYLPKIYYLTDCQVSTIKNNVEHHLECIRKYIDGGGFLPDNKKKKIYLSKHQKDMMEWSNFELRVIPCPDYDENWKYPHIKMHKWLKKLRKPVKIMKFEI